MSGCFTEASSTLAWISLISIADLTVLPSNP
jgi:hypothetical protein